MSLILPPAVTFPRVKLERLSISPCDPKTLVWFLHFPFSESSRANRWVHFGVCFCLHNPFWLAQSLGYSADLMPWSSIALNLSPGKRTYLGGDTIYPLMKNFFQRPLRLIPKNYSSHTEELLYLIKSEAKNPVFAFSLSRLCFQLIL